MKILSTKFITLANLYKLQKLNPKKFNMLYSVLPITEWVKKVTNCRQNKQIVPLMCEPYSNTKCMPNNNTANLIMHL